MGFVSGRGRANAHGSLDHDILSQHRDNRDVKCSKRIMNPGWEIYDDRPADVRTGRIIGAWWLELWMLESRSIASTNGDVAS